eukprot:TRINITY_DN16423_c0_g1_i1.p1 TRINITY_DN16423_c0_g1~~TRINITY_DN16423_c0_g1_i1.p1  ORF type:complete len:159 (+),score=29.01 TRINITY_DN16423_c0_g1_i1:26-478(+)
MAGVAANMMRVAAVLCAAVLAVGGAEDSPAVPAATAADASNVSDPLSQNSTSDVNASLEMPEGASGEPLSVVSAGFGLLGALLLVFVGWQVFKWLTSPKKTPAPLLADTELTEGDPVTSAGTSANALWMGGNGPARELMSASGSAGFTQF